MQALVSNTKELKQKSAILAELVDEEKIESMLKASRTYVNTKIDERTTSRRRDGAEGSSSGRRKVIAYSSLLFFFF